MQVDTKISCKPFPGLILKTFPLLLVTLTLSARLACAQFREDFSDNDLSSNPEWSGTREDFVINDFSELQLNAEAAGRSWLSARLDMLPSQEIEWDFRVKQSFAPSGSNFGRIYLVSDQPNVSSTLNGYFLQFGEAGAGDAIELFRQSGTNTISILRGTAGAIAGAFNARVKVRYSPTGVWELFADYAGGVDLMPEASATRINDIQGKYFGLLCTYTISNATRFYFDDIEVRTTDVPDTSPEEHPVSAGDVVINEILVDPSPVVGLPEAEFVELFNRSKDPVNLQGWQLADPATAGELPFFMLHPGAYVVVVSSSDVSAFQAFGDVLGLTRFPSLNNTGDKLKIIDDDGKIIDSLSYSSRWFRSDEKAGGGWSLERIDPNDLCGDAENWRAAESPQGGTPGRQNSVFATRPDNRGPVIKSIVATDSLTIEIVFDEKLDAGSVSASQFQLDGPQKVVEAKVSGAVATLSLSTPLISGQVYTLEVGSIFDCPGNRINPGDSKGIFVLPSRAEPGDIVINELLFNPRPTGVDFFEIYNRSGKVIDLKEWSARNFSASSPALFPLTRYHHLIYPGQFMVFTRDANVLKGEYVLGVESAFRETDIPPMNDDEGSLVLFDQYGKMIDTTYYTDTMHSPFLKDKEGVSLERISASLPGVTASNWRSASSVVGFATPGSVNSNTRADITSGFEVVVEPEIVQPYVAHHDFARIRYRFDHNGLIANVRVIDHQGRAIRTIADNELIGTQGDFRWDGDTDDGRVAGTGYYMVWFEVFDEGGQVRTYRKRVAVF